MADRWIVPCNIKFFNIIDHFASHKNVVWHNAYNMKIGDIAYIYIGKPIGEIRYKCRVINNDVSEALLNENSYAIRPPKDKILRPKKIKYAQFELLHEFEKGALTLEELRDHGLGQVQIQARTDYWLQGFITEIEKEKRYVK